MSKTIMNVETIIGTVHVPGLCANITGRCPHCVGWISLNELPPENFKGENEFTCPHCKTTLEVIDVVDD